MVFQLHHRLMVYWRVDKSNILTASGVMFLFNLNGCWVKEYQRLTLVKKIWQYLKTAGDILLNQSSVSRSKSNFIYNKSNEMVYVRDCGQKTVFHGWGVTWN